MNETAVATRGRNEVQEAREEVEFSPFGALDRIKLNVSIVQKFLCTPTKSGVLPTREDCMKFMMMCRAKRLNPFEGDAYLVGYDSRGGPKFNLITAHQAFLKRAETHPEYDGMASGVIVKPGWDCTACDSGLVKVDGKPGKCLICGGRMVIDEVEGDVVPEGQELAGGWAMVKLKNRSIPTKRRLPLGAFAQPTGSPYSPWDKNPSGMIVKCAEADALRSTFPTLLGGLYASEEGVDLLGRTDDLKASSDLKNLSLGPAPSAKQITAPRRQQPEIAAANERAARAANLPSQDEAAEAAAGLAPERAPEPPTQMQSAGPVYGEMQKQLVEICASVNASFDEFKTWGRETVGDGTTATGMLAWDTFGGFEDVPPKAAEFFVKAKRGMITGLQALKGGAK
jgi:phage recombination protein Bet